MPELAQLLTGTGWRLKFFTASRINGFNVAWNARNVISCCWSRSKHTFLFLHHVFFRPSLLKFICKTDRCSSLNHLNVAIFPKLCCIFDPLKPRPRLQLWNDFQLTHQHVGDPWPWYLLAVLMWEGDQDCFVHEGVRASRSSEPGGIYHSVQGIDLYPSADLLPHPPCPTLELRF